LAEGSRYVGGPRFPDGSVPQPGGRNRRVIEVPSIEAAIASPRGIGARFRSEPVRGPGGTQVLVEGASGNPIEIFEAAGR
jgi:catechol 2,3-dioxygenase-like lactoylglutathione lyase family enzyme